MEEALICGESIFFDDPAPDKVIEEVQLQNGSVHQTQDISRNNEEQILNTNQSNETISSTDSKKAEIIVEKSQKTKTKKRTRSYTNDSDGPGRRSQRRASKNEKTVEVPKNEYITMSSLETYKAVLKETNKIGHNITWAPEVEYSKLTQELIKDIVIEQGVPLVLKNSLAGWDLNMFSLDWLGANFNDAPLVNSPRDNDKFCDLTGWTVGQYVDYVKTPPSKRKCARLYGKDMPCPDQWTQYVADHIYPYLVYRGDYDLISNLETELQPLSLMTYVGIDNTFTPGHLDICGSMGHNIMVSCDPDSYALWFVVSKNNRYEAAQFWEKHGGSIDRDSNLLSMASLSQAPFMVYCIVQKAGDFVLVPPLSPHQVINKGGTNIKVSWNTVTPQSIHLSYLTLRELHTVAKPEVYRIKATTYSTILKYISIIENWAASSFHPSTLITSQLHENMRAVLNIYEDIVFQEDIDLDYVFKVKQSPLVPIVNDENVDTQPIKFEDTSVHSRACNFCHCDIFNRCFHCTKCDSKYSGGLDMCLECAAEGRGCAHIKELILAEYLSMDYLKGILERARQAFQLLGEKLGLPDVYLSLPKPFRGFSDLSAATVAFHRIALIKEDEVENCHHCKRKKKRSILISCTQGCKKRFCENCLWNRHGIKLAPLLRKPSWVCLACTGACNCAVCLRKQGKDPYDEDAVDWSFLNSAKSLDEVGVILSKDHNELMAKTDEAPKPRPKSREWYNKVMKKFAEADKPQTEQPQTEQPSETPLLGEPVIQELEMLTQVENTAAIEINS